MMSVSTVQPITPGLKLLSQTSDIKPLLCIAEAVQFLPTFLQQGAETGGILACMMVECRGNLDQPVQKAFVVP